MNIKKIKNIIFASLFAALICLFNLVLHFPTPGGNGFVNIGDSFIILSGALFGPIGILGSAIGSVISDLVLGYTLYIPATLIIKALIAVSVYLFTRNKVSLKNLIFGGIIGEIIVVLGYLIFEYFIIGLQSGALLNIPFNIIQGIVSIVISAALFKPTVKIASYGGKIHG